MKKLYALIVLPALLVTGACTEADEPPVDTSVPIGFSTQVEAVTKTPTVITADGKDGTTELTKFWVFGLYGSSGNYSYEFENIGVSDSDGDNVWDTETLGFWRAGETYRFAAYSDGNQSLPTGSREDKDSKGVNDNNGTFRINDYEAEDRDLVVATVISQKADDFIQDFKEGKNPCVPLTFEHILSMLTFTFTNETSKEIEVADIRFTVENKANFRSDNWDSHDTPKERKLHADAPLKVAAKATATSDAAFIIPQGNEDVIVTFTVYIRETNNEGGSLVFSRRYTSNLATETNKWSIGHRYNYNATIPQNVMEGADITLNVSVKGWETEDTNVSWGGKDEDSESSTNNP